MPVEVIPFDQLVDRASLNNPVFKAAGVGTPETPAAKPAEISFSEIQPVSLPGKTAQTGEIDLGDVVNVDSFPRRTSEDLSADDKFNPTQYYAQNPDVAKDPTQLAKLLAAYRAKREKGITPAVIGEAAKAAPGIAKKFGKGVYQLGSNIFQLTGLQALANDILGAGETPQVRAELMKESDRQAKEAGAEIAAGTETAATGLSDLARTGFRKLQTSPVLAGTPAKAKSDQELLQDLNADVAFQKQLAEVGKGSGEVLKAAGIDAATLEKEGVHLEPDVIENLSLVDPVTMVAFGGGFKLLGTGGKLLATVPTVAKGAELIEKFGAAIPKIIGGGLKAAGKTVPTVAAVAPPVAGLVKAGPFGLVSGLYAAERLAPKAAKVGEAVQNLGEQIAGNAPRSATLQTIIDAAKAPIVTGPIKGAAAGTVAAVPLAAAAEGNEQAGAILGGGAALGTLAGGLHGGKAQLGEFAASRLFDPHSVKFVPIESPGYGVDPALDAANQKQLSKLSVNERGTLTTFREAFRPLGAEIYSVDNPTYVNGIVDAISRQEGRPATAAEIAAAQQQANTQGYFDYNRADGRRVVLLNGDLGAILHEPGHLFDSLLSPEKKAELVTAVRENYTPEQISALKAQYEKRFGQAVSDQYFLNELIAENFSAIFNNVPVTELTAPPGFIKKLAAVVGEGAEALGIDLTRGRTTPDLNVPVSFELRKIFQNAAREVTETQAAPGLPTPGAPKTAQTSIPNPAKPGVPAIPTMPTAPSGTAPTRPAPAPAPAAPTPTPAGPIPTPAGPIPTPAARNIRVTPGQQDAFARRAAETGVDTAKSLAAKSGDAELTQRVNEVSNFMQSGNPVLEIEHRGIVSEGTAPEGGVGRTTRRAEQESGYAELERLRVENRANAPESVVNTHQKTFVPVRWTEQGNTPTLIAMSLDKVISNVHRIVKAAADRGAESLIPYESQQGRLTEAGWNKVVADAQAYAENQSNGFRGDGQRLTRPTEDVGLSIPAENPDYRPQILGDAEANFQNLIQGLATPETAREIKGAVPGNVKGQVLAEVNVRPLETPAGIKPKNIGKQEFKSTPGRRLQEVNPLRNELVRRGVDVRQLIEVTERIRAKDIASVAPRQDLNFKAPVTDIIRGGFLPGEEKKTPVASPDIQKLAEDYSKTSGVAYRPAGGYSEVKPELAKKLADFYDSVPSNPTDPAVKASYDALAKETLDQYNAIVKAGYKLEPWTGQGEPYKSSAEAIADIRDNKHLFVLPTEGNFVGAENNPMLRPSGIAGLPTVNDVFRGVHDFFGHGKEGYSFGPRGEFNAWRAHSEMYSPAAQGALAAETLAQNSWVNFGKHLRNESGNVPSKGQPGYKGLTERPFAEQKAVVVPDELIQEAKSAAVEIKRVGFLPADAPQLVSEIQKVKSGESDGQTFNLDGTVFNPGDQKLDVVTLASQNVPIKQLAPKALADFVEKYPGVEQNPAIKAGVFKLAGDPNNARVSLDLNVVVDQAHRENTKKFATDNQQQAIFDLANFSNIETGGTGETVLKSPAAIADAAEKLARGEPVEVKLETVALPSNKENFDGYVNQVASADANQFRDLAKKWGGGFTTEAWRVGREVTTPEQVATLKQLQTEQETAGREALAKGDFDAATPAAFKSQFFREAWEAATGEGSAGLALRQREPGYKPPFPAGEKGPQFLPRTAKGAELSKEGFDFRISGQPGSRGVTVLKDGISIGELTSKQISPKEAEISLANLSKSERGKGVGEAAYRELLTQLKDDGVKEVGGSIVAPEPLAIRRKIFGGDFKKLERNLEPVSIDDALASLNELRRGSKDLIHVEAVNEIRPESQFLPPEAEQTFKGFEEISPEKKAKLYIARRRARAADNTPEALPPKYARDEDGNPVIGQDGKPKPITVDYNLIDTPLAKEAAKGLRGADREKAAAEAIGDQLVKAYKTAAKNPEIEAGSKWYSTARVRLKKLFGDDSKFFAELLGATSARTPVETNFRFALDAYNRFKAGDYDKSLAKYREGKQAWEDGDVKDFVKDTGNENPTRGQFLDWWVDQNNLSPVQSNGKKFGANSRAVLRVLDGSWQSEVKGPKTPNFAGNLTGATFEATVDVWAARALHRLANLKNEKPWRILPENETGVTDADFYLGQAAYRHAAEKLGIKPDALQAVLWFAEKNHWEKAGWTRGAGAEKSDFNSLLSETEKVAPGKFKMKTSQKELAFLPGETINKAKKLLDESLKSGTKRFEIMGHPLIGDWENFGKDLIDEEYISPHALKIGPTVFTDVFRENGYDRIAVYGNGSHHDSQYSPYAVKKGDAVKGGDDSWVFPMTDEGVKKAFEYAKKSELADYESAYGEHEE
jgi:hypothetical protein